MDQELLPGSGSPTRKFKAGSGINKYIIPDPQHWLNLYLASVFWIRILHLDPDPGDENETVFMCLKL